MQPNQGNSHQAIAEDGGDLKISVSVQLYTIANHFANIPGCHSLQDNWCARLTSDAVSY